MNLPGLESGIHCTSTQRSFLPNETGRSEGKIKKRRNLLHNVRPTAQHISIMALPMRRFPASKCEPVRRRRVWTHENLAAHPAAHQRESWGRCDSSRHISTTAPQSMNASCSSIPWRNVPSSPFPQVHEPWFPTFGQRRRTGRDDNRASSG